MLDLTGLDSCLMVGSESWCLVSRYFLSFYDLLDNEIIDNFADVVTANIENRSSN